MLLLLLFLVGRIDFDWGDYEYCYFETRKSWGDAERACQHWGGHLASINSRAEMAELYQILGKKLDYWIGFIDHSGINTGYQWVDGSGGFAYWADGQPMHGIRSRMCTVALTHYSGHWHNIGCWYEEQYLCKKVSYAVKLHL